VIRRRQRVWTAAVCVIASLVATAKSEAACQVTSGNAATFTSVTSFEVRANVQQSSTSNAGITCSGAVLSVLQSGDHFYATVTSANGALKAATGETISYAAYATSGTQNPITFGSQFDYASGSLLNLLGLFGGSSASLPMFFRTVTGANRFERVPGRVES
jgi:hypothetical protein